MTLARTALRLAALYSLQGANASSGPTIANNRIYDSRITDFSPETFPSDAQPTVIIMTDSDEGEQLSRQNGGPPFRRNIDLVFELGIVQALKDGSDFVIGYPDTDARHEASLDVLEFQLARRLGYDADPSSVLFRKIARPHKRDCHRQVLDDAGVKIACRILTWTCEVTDDQIMTYNSANDVPSGLEALPEPLRSVAAAMPAGSSGADVCNTIIDALSALTIGPLEGVDFTIDSITKEDDMFDVSIEIRSAMDTPQIIASGGPVVIDYAKGTFQNLILAANVTALSIINWPKNAKTGRLILKVTNTGAFHINAAAWPATTEWVNGGNPPVITQGAGSIDLLVLVSGSAGQEIFGNVAGQNYKTPA